MIGGLTITCFEVDNGHGYTIHRETLWGPRSLEYGNMSREEQLRLLDLLKVSYKFLLKSLKEEQDEEV